MGDVVEDGHAGREARRRVRRADPHHHQRRRVGEPAVGGDKVLDALDPSQGADEEDVGTFRQPGEDLLVGRRFGSLLVEVLDHHRRRAGNPQVAVVDHRHVATDAVQRRGLAAQDRSDAEHAGDGGGSLGDAALLPRAPQALAQPGSRADFPVEPVEIAARAGVPVLVPPEDQRHVDPGQCDGERVGEPTVGRDQIRPEALDQPTQTDDRLGVGERWRRVPVGVLGDPAGPTGQVADPVHRDGGPLEGRRLVVPGGRHLDRVATVDEFVGEQLHAAAGAADVGAPLVADHEDPQRLTRVHRTSFTVPLSSPAPGRPRRVARRRWSSLLRA